ncbi:MAG TPA: ThiF family adenylyltransferase [Verrucomicrobiales bacterium]|nr:ThiF family adenylyltransferase [Verrucomicrobiales bacterium]
MNPSLRLTGRQYEELIKKLHAPSRGRLRLICGQRNRVGAPIFTAMRLVSGSTEEPGFVCSMEEVPYSAAEMGYVRFHNDGSLSGELFRGQATPFSKIAVAGKDILFWGQDVHGRHELPANTRNVQAFGEGTIGRLGGLSFAVVGCSGLGFPAAQALAGQGVGRLVLVDPETIEDVNLNRLPGVRLGDVGKLKVEFLADYLADSAFHPEVVPLASSIINRQAALEVAECDVIFGCLDSVEARHFLNRLAAAYSIPYFDLGVCLKSDGRGGVTDVCGSVHYLQPDGSSLLSRGVYDMQSVQDEGLRRTDPAEFARRLEDKYVRGALQKRPTVLPLNMAIASYGVMELMARLHPFRTRDNDHFGAQCLSFRHGMLDSDPEGDPCPALALLCGSGDTDPFLGLPSFVL